MSTEEGQTADGKSDFIDREKTQIQQKSVDGKITIEKVQRCEFVDLSTKQSSDSDDSMDDFVVDKNNTKKDKDKSDSEKKYLSAKENQEKTHSVKPGSIKKKCRNGRNHFEPSICLICDELVEGPTFSFRQCTRCNMTFCLSCAKNKGWTKQPLRCVNKKHWHCLRCRGKNGFCVEGDHKYCTHCWIW